MKTIKLTVEVECANDYEASGIVNEVRKAFLGTEVKSSTINYQEIITDYNECFEEE